MKTPPGFVVAIDGPSGAGKTAAGMLLAERLGAVFVDTGIFYRALTLLALDRGVPTGGGAALIALVAEITSEVVEPARGCVVTQVRVAGEPVGPALRSPEVDARVSEVATHPEVRRALLSLQRQAANGAPAVVAGRDIGTVVFPEAALKVYLDASPEERALRRARQLGARGADVAVAQSIAARDAQDSGRSVAPLAKAGDAAVIDTDALSLEQVVEELTELVHRRLVRAHVER